MNRPKVSVVTITYGHENFIVETIKGILSQDYQGEIEFIIANDNSPDKSDQLIKDYLKSIHIANNITIKYTKHSSNKGIMPNFIWALNQCTGEYIALCEGDDYWTDPKKLMKQISFLESNKEYSLSAHNAIIKYEGSAKERVFSDIKVNREITPSEIIKKWMIPTASMVFRKTVIEQIPNWVLDIYSGDFTLALLAMSKGKIFFMTDIMSVYRVDFAGTSASATYKDKVLFIFQQQIKLLNYFNEYSVGAFNKDVKKQVKFLSNEIKFLNYRKKSVLSALFFMPTLFVRKSINRLFLNS